MPADAPGAARTVSIVEGTAPAAAPGPAQASELHRDPSHGGMKPHKTRVLRQPHFLISIFIQRRPSIANREALFATRDT